VAVVIQEGNVSQGDIQTAGTGTELWTISKKLQLIIQVLNNLKYLI
jgi:hypothetical protein